MSALRGIVPFGAPLAPLALLASLGCARSGELRVLADTTTAPVSVEVLASPFDPATLEPPDAARRAADSLDRLFQRERAALNARADRLAGSDRRTPAYVEAYAAYSLDATAAEGLRAARDSARRLAHPRAPLARARLQGAVRAPLVAGAATIAVTAGAWWIAVLDSNGALTRDPAPVVVRAGGHDTVRIRRTDP